MTVLFEYRGSLARFCNQKVETLILKTPRSMVSRIWVCNSSLEDARQIWVKNLLIAAKKAFSRIFVFRKHGHCRREKILMHLLFIDKRIFFTCHIISDENF